MLFQVVPGSRPGTYGAAARALKKSVLTPWA
jgi:hypothetical protein